MCNRSVALQRQQRVNSNSIEMLHFMRPTVRVLERYHSDTTTQQTTDSEIRLTNKLQQTFPKAVEIRVHDISGLHY